MTEFRLNTTREERDAAEKRLREDLENPVVVGAFRDDLNCVLDELARVREERQKRLEAYQDELEGRLHLTVERDKLREELESAIKVVAAGHEVIRLLHGKEPPFSNIDAKRVALLNLENALGRFGGRDEASI
jgi:hypothetical protein